jgi:hypothetical protein
MSEGNMARFAGTLRKVRTNDDSKRAVIHIVPINASNAAFLSVTVGVLTLAASAATPASPGLEGPTQAVRHRSREIQGCAAEDQTGLDRGSAVSHRGWRTVRPQLRRLTADLFRSTIPDSQQLTSGPDLLKYSN